MNIIATAIRRPVTVAMFTLAALVFGLVLVNRLGFNLLPELTYPTLTVRTDFEGAAPAEVENLITRPLEGVLGTIKGLRQLRSVSKAGRSDIYLEFYWGTNIDVASLDVREKMEQVQLPVEVAAPSLLRFNPNNDPIIRMSLSKKLNEDEDPIASLAQLRRYADLQLSRRMETVEGVAASKASGGLEDEIQILLDQSQLAQLNVSVADIANRLKTQNINMSGGQIRNGQQQLLVRTFNEYRSIEDFANTIILSKSQRVVRLKDVAHVSFTHKDPTAIIRHNGEQAVELAIYKEGDANTVKVAEAVKIQLKRLEKSLPEGMQLVMLTDASKFIEQAISELISSAIIGGLLAMIIIYLFLGEFMPTLIISATIPLSIIITFNLMFGAKIDMNIMSLGGLALAVGMLVDNAIVVLENIARKKEQGASLAQAALEGATEVSGAITASTLTTIAVFLPLVFVEGIAGQLFRDQALTITFSLIVSLAVALTLIPTMAAYGLKKSKEIPVLERTTKPIWLRILIFPFELLILIFTTIFFLIKMTVFGISKVLGFVFVPARKVFEAFFNTIASFYKGLLRASLNAKSITLILAFGILALSLFFVKQIPQVVLPEMAQGEFVVKVQYSPGTAIELTDRKVVALSESLVAVDGVKEVFATAGVGNKLTANPEQEGENQAEFTLLLESGISREQENQLLGKLRELLAEESGGLTADAERPQLFSFSTPLSIQIYGYDIDTLKRAAEMTVAALSKSDRFIDLHSNMKKGYPEAQITFDQEKMAQLGLSIEQANRAVVNAIRGNKATRYRLREQQIEVLVRLEDSARDELDDVRNLIINPASPRPIPLHAVAEIKETQGPSEIMRIDQQRVILVEGQLRTGGIGEAVAEAKEILDSVRLPFGTNFQFGGQGEEMENSYNSLMMALALAIFMVYLVMASQFESLLHPFIILLSIPLAVIGAIFALIITQTEISVVVFLGLIMLAGIVVNNAIVLIDRINQLRVAGVEKIKAITEAAESRLRPILMTTLTTTLGMIPLAIGIGEGTEIRAPMAITVIGGLLASTLLTLIVIPVMYQILDRKDYSKIVEVNSIQIDAEA
ncbi:efflux RND transporter permease subunit [Aliikangiella coralliicola]|uniref:Efflux RND transporter permease subunit n=1 Tax=Aliikangiella coralliicola TaxID=2592383 RepID=A0A545U0B9_9GAMM|nr:efflux RND transporter permease subunit [Aliikangiella coralliicola]TQV82909.1 efflux RND transporter permease subunit [Aliikangiella coralliicola]